jgi:hypothetical protein
MKFWKTKKLTVSLCGQNAEFYYGKAGGTYANHRVLKKPVFWMLLSSSSLVPKCIILWQVMLNWMLGRWESGGGGRVKGSGRPSAELWIIKHLREVSAFSRTVGRPASYTRCKLCSLSQTTSIKSDAVCHTWSPPNELGKDTALIVFMFRLFWTACGMK